MKKYFLFLLTAVVLFPSWVQAEQNFGEPGMGMRRGEGFPEKLHRNRERIEMVRMWKLTQALNLDEKRAAQLFPVLHRYDEKRWDLEMEHKNLVKELRKILKVEKPDEKEIASAIEKIGANFDAQQNLYKEELESLKDIFSLQELGEYILFQEEFKRDLRQVIWNIRKGGHGRSGMREPGPPRENRQ